MFKLGSFEFDRTYVILILFSIICIMEALRLTGRWTFGLFRDYERRRISAPFWFTATTSLVILLTPQWFAVPIVLGVTFGDPVIGELRRMGLRSYPLAGWVVCLIPFLFYSYNPVVAALIAATATAAEILIKIDNDSILYTIGILDDNFTMNFFPALVLAAIWLITEAAGFPLLPPGTEEILRPIY